MIDALCSILIKELNIRRVIETGTDKAETVAQVSRWFAAMDPGFGTIASEIKTGSRSYQSNSTPIAYPVFINASTSPYQIHSVDVDEHSYRSAKELFQSNPNIFLHHGSSQEFLETFLANEPGEGNDLFFLDAHWGKYWPLRDELAVIRALDKFLIVIDDFMVPGKSNPSLPHGAFGFDMYKGRILNWAYISDAFTSIDARVFYPAKPNRDGRGWVLIARGYTAQQLAFLKNLDLFEVDQHDPLHAAVVKPTLRSYIDGKNLLKTVIPVPLLRQMHRLYERISK